MATTELLLTMLQKQFTGWARDGDRGILTYLNQAQMILCNVEADQRMIIDGSTGRLPSFDTQEGVFEYTLPDNVYFVTDIMVEADALTTLVDNIWSQDYGRTTRTHRRPNEYFEVSGILYLRIPFIRTTPWYENSNVTVKFTEDVDLTNNIYRYKGFERPTEITSDTIPLSIHPPYDLTVLLPATALLLEAVQHGNYLEAYQTIENVYIPKMQKGFNIGAFGYDLDAQDRGF